MRPRHCKCTVRPLKSEPHVIRQRLHAFPFLGIYTALLFCTCVLHSRYKEAVVLFYFSNSSLVGSYAIVASRICYIYLDTMSAHEVDLLDDTRITHCYAELNGLRYHYLLGKPKGEARGTVFLIHGWPDCSMGWRNQIPMFLDLGYRCVAPDIMGFGRTTAPDSLSMYGFKRAADDIKALAEQLGCSRIILGGHDWGGAIVYRVALWYPDLITHLFSICTPYLPPRKDPFIPLETMVEKYLPQFRYQIHLASGEVEKVVNSNEKMHQFFKALFGSQGPNGERGFDVYKGLLPENLPKLGPCPLLKPKVHL